MSCVAVGKKRSGGSFFAANGRTFMAALSTSASGRMRQYNCQPSEQGGGRSGLTAPTHRAHCELKAVALSRERAREQMRSGRAPRVPLPVAKQNHADHRVTGTSEAPSAFLRPARHNCHIRPARHRHKWNRGLRLCRKNHCSAS